MADTLIVEINSGRGLLVQEVEFTAYKSKQIRRRESFAIGKQYYVVVKSLRNTEMNGAAT